MPQTCCFMIFQQCVQAVNAGELIEAAGAKDKEFHFQNWFQARLESLEVHFESGGRNAYPDFSLVEYAEGYEIKGLAWPGRERDYDANSQAPTGFHNGRCIFYAFGRYPADRPYGSGHSQYPVVDLVICHGDFLNPDHKYIHENKHVTGFGAYGDIKIRDRKMYVAPTPFALTEGTTGLMTLIVPEAMKVPDSFRAVGLLTRTEADTLVVAYKFDLRTRRLAAEHAPNPRVGTEHHFTAYRLMSQTNKPVTMSPQILEDGS